MKKVIFLVVIIFGSLSISIAQTITGTVALIDNRPLNDVYVQLFQLSDSVLISVSTTNKTGFFSLNFSKHSSFMLKFSHIGYQDILIVLNECNESVDLGIITIEEDIINLNDVVIKVNTRIEKIDRQIIFPTENQIETSTSGYEILNKLALPGLLIDENLHTVSNLSGNGEVQIRINNVIASKEDIISLNPKDLLRVEYIDNPGVRYGENMGIVVNLIVKRQTSGLVAGVNLTNALSYGLDNFYLKANRKRSEYGFSYSFGYQNFDKLFVDEIDNYTMLDNTLFSIEKKGTTSELKKHTHNSQLNYTSYIHEQSVFNAVLRFVSENNPINIQNQIVTETNYYEYNLIRDVSDNFISPSLDLYYQLKTDNNQSFTTNIVGTYISSDYSYSQKEFDLSMENQIDEYAYKALGEKYSLITDFIYEKMFNNINFSSGLQYTQNYLENQYQSVEKSTSKMVNSNYYLYSQIKGNILQLNYMTGIGISSQNYKQKLESFSYWTFRPSISVSYPVIKNGNLSYQFNIRTHLPEIHNLSDISLQINRFEYIVGNPNLKPFRNYINRLSFSFQTTKLYTQISAIYMISPKAIMQIIERKIDDFGNIVFQFAPLNQKSMNQFVTQGYLQFDIIPDKFLIMGYGGINRFFSFGNHYTRTYTSFFGGLQGFVYLGQWSISGNINSRYNSLFGETIWYNEPSSDFNLNYKIKDIQLGISWLYPLQNNGLNNKEVLMNPFITKEKQTTMKDYGNMILLKFVWNISTGRKYHDVQKTINNSDLDSGVIKR